MGTHDESVTLVKALGEIKDLWRKGKFPVTRQQEDGHTAIEQYITEKYGEVGKKIHTGRSRNDQSMTMIRLYALDKARHVKKLVEQLAAAVDSKASKHKDIPMPGYTHMQRAMPTNVGMWLGAFGSGWRDSAHMLSGAIEILNQNPL